MSTLPTASSILLLPVGTSFGTVDSATHATYSAISVLADKDLICHWLYNAKQINHRKQTNYLDPGTPDTDTNIDYFAALDGPEFVTAHPIPDTYIDPFIIPPVEVVYPYAISLQSNATRWRDSSNNISLNDFYVYVHEGNWYWFPGYLGASQVVSILNDTSFTVTVDDSGDIYTDTYEIIDTFYP